MPYDQKLAAQAAKLGKPMAEAGKGSKTVAPLGELATRLMAIGDNVDAPVKAAGQEGRRQGRSR